MADYPVQLAQSTQRLTIAELPANGLDLYIVEHAAAGVLGIGTPGELRDLIADGILPPADEISFRLEAVAA